MAVGIGAIGPGISGTGGGGGGTGNQTGTGSPVGVVTPLAAGALYTDQSTGNIWVAKTTSNASWVQIYAPYASPVLTGTPTAPTAAPGDGSTQVATDAFVAAAVTAATNPSLYLAATYR